MRLTQGSQTRILADKCGAYFEWGSFIGMDTTTNVSFALPYCKH